MKKCPIYKATRNKVMDEGECTACPFRDNCIEDIFNDAIERVMIIIGEYLNENKY